MAAKDYKICPALFNAYIAKVSKRNPNQMTDDRRPIEEGEIMMLIDWYLDNELGEKYKSISFESHAREGMKVKLTYIKAEEENEQVQQTMPTEEGGKTVLRAEIGRKNIEL